MRIKFLLLAAMMQLALGSSVAFAVPSGCTVNAGNDCSCVSAPGGSCTTTSGKDPGKGFQKLAICTDPDGSCTACFRLTGPHKPNEEGQSLCQCVSGSAEECKNLGILLKKAGEELVKNLRGTVSGDTPGNKTQSSVGW